MTARVQRTEADPTVDAKVAAHDASAGAHASIRASVVAEEGARTAADLILANAAAVAQATAEAKAPLVHGHVISDVAGLRAELDTLTDPTELSAAIVAAINAHALSDATDAELVAAIASEVANRDTAIAAAVASLTTAINAKQDAATAATDAEVAAAITAALTPEAWHIVGATGEPAYLGDFGAVTTVAAAYQTARYRKLASGLVILQGAFTKATAGASGDVVFKLPAAYRPSEHLRFGAARGVGTAVHPFDVVGTNGGVSAGDVTLRTAAAAAMFQSFNATWMAA